MADFDVDLFVIGAGSGGVRAARIAAQYGARVMIAEEYRVGGTCVIRGCVPKKLLVYASRYAHDFEDAAGFGWSVPPARFDWAALIANKDKEIGRLEGIYRSNLEKAGVAVVESRAVLEDEHTVRLVASDANVRAKYILIATGAAPHHGPAIPGIAHVMSSNEAFHLPELPQRVLIQGGGYIAMEFAAIFEGLGAEVTVVYRGDNILRGFDDDVRAHLRGEMERRGMRVKTGCTVTAVEKKNGGFLARLSNGEAVESDRVMFALGRRPNIGALGLDRAGVLVTKDGGISVDEYSCTSVPNIYAVGDVTNRVHLTPVAIREGHAFADTVFGGKPTAVDYSVMPTAVFTEPEVGVVGLTEVAARSRVRTVDVYKSVFRPLRATLSGRDTRVMMKLVVDGDTDRLLGCHIVGHDAGEMIQLVGIAVQMKATKADFDATMAVHPTAAEELVTMRTRASRHVQGGAEENLALH